ncbi:Gfo/Idh/MocA family protein [Albirhodobacter sp. R86504]|jgi:predicted dehydrogenase|uniref:Gfo/Idh/MocA family protein n=1 Tax=Albirhodobacter sp. R86504 TaxID=3093848 RepID=UPI0036710084
MQTINWGILGAAAFARDHMGPAIHAAKGTRLAALATSQDAKADAFRAINPDLRVYQSYDDLLADPAIDVVYVPLPNMLHVEWTKKALAAGKHVLTEKPIAMHAQEIDALIALRDATGKLAAEAYMIVHHPQWHTCRRLIAEGAIGALRHVDTAFTFDKGDEPDNIRNRPETGGGGVRDIGVYTYSSVRFATGAEPDTLRSIIRWENGIDVHCTVIGEMAGNGHRFTYGALTAIRLSNRQEITFQGSDGTIRMTAPFNAEVYAEPELHLIRKGEPIQVHRFNGARQYINQVEAFCASIRDGKAYPWTLEDSRGTQAMIDQVFASEI